MRTDILSFNIVLVLTPLLLLLGGQEMPGQANGVTWGPLVNVSSTPTNANFPEMAIDQDNGTILVTWQDTASGSSTKDIFLATTSINGAPSFSIAANLSSSSENSDDHSIIIDLDSNVNVIYIDIDSGTSGSGTLRFRRSTDGGSTFSTPVDVATPIKSDPSSPTLRYGFDFAIPFVHVGAVYADEVLRVINSSDSGTSWSQPVKVSDGPASSPDIVVAGSTLNAVWQKVGEVFFGQSSDNGQTFSPEAQVTPDGWSISKTSWGIPGTEDLGGGLTVVYQVETGPIGGGLYSQRSTDVGLSWSAPTKIDDTPEEVLEYDLASRAFNTGNISIGTVWVEQVTGTPTDNDVFFSQSLDGGASWSPPVRLDVSTNFAFSPQIEIDAAGGFHFSWLHSDLTSPPQITGGLRYLSASNGGTSGSSPINIPGRSAFMPEGLIFTSVQDAPLQTEISANLRMKLDGQGRPHFVYQNAPFNTLVSDVFYAHIDDLGVSPPPQTWTWLSPFSGSVAGLNNSFFTTESTLTNRGSTMATVDLEYTAAFGGGSGSTQMMIPPGQQVIIPDTIEDLRTRGVPLPLSGNRGGTLRMTFSGISSPLTLSAALARTSTVVAEGRAGLAYPAVSSQGAFNEPVDLTGLRQNAFDRSNVAFQNLGTAAEGNITIRTTIFSGDPALAAQVVLSDQTVPPGGFFQHSGVLGGFSNGYVKVERVSGTAPFYAYGVINDQANSDGSFVFPVTESSLVGKTGQTLPVIVETGAFNSELTLVNFSASAKTIDFEFVADVIQTANNTASFSLTLQPGEQRIIPDVVEDLRQQGVMGIGPAGTTFAGGLFATVPSGDMSGIVIGARTGSPGGGGQYGLFYNAVPFGSAASSASWIYGLQQNAENRSNLALVNTGEVDGSDGVFSIDIYDGDTGILVNSVNGVTVGAKRWHQINGILGLHASGTSQGYAQVRKTSGNNPFITYGVINDGAGPGQRSGDGAYVPAQ